MHAYWQLCALCAVLQSFCCIRDGRFSSTSKIAKFSRVPVSSFKILPAYGQMHACMHCVRTVRPVEKTACCVIGGFPAPGPALPPRRVCVCVPVPPAPPPQNKRTGQEGIQSSLPSSWPASSQHPTQRQHVTVACRLLRFAFTLSLRCTAFIPLPSSARRSIRFMLHLPGLHHHLRSACVARTTPAPSTAAPYLPLLPVRLPCPSLFLPCELGYGRRYLAS